MSSMHLALLWAAVCLLPGASALPLPQEAGDVTELQWKQAQDYLKQFYVRDSKIASSFKDKLEEMQKFFHLPITGKLNSRIIEIMRKPRCGIPDVAEYSLFQEKPKWNSKVVTYRIVSYTTDLPRITVDQIVEKALSMWSQEIPLHFKRVRLGIADIMIGFARGAHGDFNPFDGPGNVLAHAFPPGPGIGGDAHFDNDERWTRGNNLGIDFLYAATHELGHSLGLGHSSDPNAVMYPTYGYRDSETFNLSWNDIESIQELYGNVWYQEREMILRRDRTFRKNTYSCIAFYISTPQPEGTEELACFLYLLHSSDCGDKDLMLRKVMNNVAELLIYSTGIEKLQGPQLQFLRDLFNFF